MSILATEPGILFKIRTDKFWEQYYIMVHSNMLSNNTECNPMGERSHQQYKIYYGVKKSDGNFEKTIPVFIVSMYL